MSQDAESGKRAAEYGHKTAAQVAEQIGAKRVTPHANEFEYKGQRVTIRTAREKTDSVGVTYNMLKRLQLVIGAFEVAPNEYELYSLSPHLYQANLRDSLTGKGKVGLVRRKVFLECGTFVARVDLPAT